MCETAFLKASYVSEVRESYLRKKKNEKELRILKSDFYKEVNKRIINAAEEGKPMIELYPISMEEIGDYMDNHSIVPAEKLKFTEEQLEILYAYKEFGKFHVGLTSIPFAYEDGSTSNVMKVTIHW